MQKRAHISMGLENQADMDAAVAEFEELGCIVEFKTFNYLMEEWRVVGEEANLRRWLTVNGFEDEGDGWWLEDLGE